MRGGHTDGIVVDVGMPVIHRGVRYNCRHSAAATAVPIAAAAPLLRCPRPAYRGLQGVRAGWRGPMLWLCCVRSSVPDYVSACRPALRRVFLLNRRVLLIRPKLHLANDGNYRHAAGLPAKLPAGACPLDDRRSAGSAFKRQPWRSLENCCCRCSFASFRAALCCACPAPTAHTALPQGDPVLCHLEAAAADGGALAARRGAAADGAAAVPLWRRG